MVRCMTGKKRPKRRDAGRPRGAPVARAVLRETLEELATSGLEGLSVERDPARVETCRAVVGDDVPATHRAAALGRPTLLLRSDPDNLLLGLRNGPSGWYASFEVQDRDDATALAGWLSRC